MLSDPWKSVREEICFGNIEPKVYLVAATDYPEHSEDIVAVSASVSYGSTIDSHEGCVKLNKNLIARGHLTPLEAIQFNFFISGISKLCGAQISRHRIGQGHVSGSRRFKIQGNRFIYPLLNYIKTEEEARNIYKVMSMSVRDSLDVYNQIIQNTIGVKKSDARYVIPASTATERYWWINARALRDFFRLRLAPDAEWEIRRIAEMLLKTVYTATPSLFQDIVDAFPMDLSK